MSSVYLGIDIGGSGVKGALVDLDRGRLVTRRIRVETPQPATPEAVGETLVSLVSGYDHEGPIGIGFPAVVRDGIVSTANNIDDGWIGRDAASFFSGLTGRSVTITNDADAAAIAEATYGAARGIPGVVLMLTFGTGIGSGLLLDGELLPNVELGQIELDGHSPAEVHFSAKARRREGLDWEEWGARANRYLTHVDAIFNPNRIVVGGGLTRKWREYAAMIDDSLPVVPAKLGNSAGLVGAALAARRSETQ